MGSGHHHDHHHHDPGFIRKYVFSVDHKVIGIQYAVTSLVFLFFGFCLMMLMRWQLAYPGKALPWIGKLFGEAQMPGGVMLPEFYNSLGAMHGTIMVFLGVVPMLVGGFGNYVMPLQIGAPDMSFPKLNMLSYWVFLPGGIIMLASSSPRRRGQFRLDVLCSAVRVRHDGTDHVAHRNGLPDHFVAAGFGELHYDDPAASGEGADHVPPALLRVEPVRYRVPASARVSAT